ncbi:hypothetical protein BVRB_7g167040 [Beta vulgaris subsp. vulgaris]|nr:hypothetical protein BVRB_7g167040 [Beta vulgaris subsp. vulgaris]
MMAADRRFGYRAIAGMGEALPQYDSLQAKLKSLTLSDQVQKFDLKVTEGLYSIPEGAAGRIQRSIMSSDGGQLHVHYVNVLEKGDTYEISSFSHKAEMKRFAGSESSVLTQHYEQMNLTLSIPSFNLPGLDPIYQRKLKKVLELEHEKKALQISRNQLLAIIVPVVGFGIFLWWAGRDIIQDSVWDGQCVCFQICSFMM